MRKAAAAVSNTRNTASRRPAPAATRGGPVRAVSPAPSRRAPVTRIDAKAALSPAAPPVRKLAPVQPIPVAPPSPPAHADHPFRGLLVARRQELTGNLEDTKFDTLAKMGRVADDDQAQMSHEEFISLQRNSMDYAALRLVNAAIERINTGEYGICAQCEEPISEKRLKAIPWAIYCVHCQDRVQAIADGTDEEDLPTEGW